MCRDEVSQRSEGETGSREWPLRKRSPRNILGGTDDRMRRSLFKSWSPKLPGGESQGNAQTAHPGLTLSPFLEYLGCMFKRLMSKTCIINTRPSSACHCISIQAGTHWAAERALGVKCRQSLKKLGLSPLNMDSVMDHFVHSCRHLSTKLVIIPVTILESWRTGVRVKHAAKMQKRFKNSPLCTLPALDQRGLLLAAVESGHSPDHSWADRKLLPAIYGAFLPSPCSAATGGSGYRWCLASAGPGGSPPATDYWEGSISGWTHPWWRNNYTRKTIIILMEVLWKC